MTSVFGATYSTAYDHLYSGKDYEHECDLIESQMVPVLGAGAWTLLDLGCGTGSHAVPLALRGHKVTGVDRSADMLAQARLKAERAKADIRFVESDIRHVQLDQRFDAALMMFAVLGYQTSNSAALEALATARRHVRKGGAFFFDVWFGPAVLEQRPERRFRDIPTPKGQILRAVNSILEPAHQVCTVEIELWSIEGDKVTGRAKESHAMRYFFPLELELLLGQSGFKLLKLGQFEAPEVQPDAGSWNIIGLAQAV